MTHFPTSSLNPFQQKQSKQKETPEINMTKTDKHSNDSNLVEKLHNPATRSATFSIIVKEYSERLYWHIRHIALTHEDSNDILQNTFIKAWNNIDKFRGDSQLLTWLYRIATNETLTYIGHKQIETISLDSDEGSVANELESDPLFNGDHADALLHEAINHLPEKQRLVFNMRYFEDLKYEEISQILDTSTGALKASYHIAVKKIEDYVASKD